MDMLWEWTLERALWSKVTHTLQDSVPIRANNNETIIGSINNHQGCHRTTCVPVCTSSSGRRGNQMIIIDVRVSLSLTLSLSLSAPPFSRYLCPAESDSFISHDCSPMKLVVPSSSFREYRLSGELCHHTTSGSGEWGWHKQIYRVQTVHTNGLNYLSDRRWGRVMPDYGGLKSSL